MSTVAYARWDVFVGVVGVLTAIPVLIALIATQLPSRKLKGLDEALMETETVLNESIEEGILRDYQIGAFKERLELLRNRTTEVRARVHAARTWSEDLENWVQGLTSKITQIIKDVKEVRSTISTTSTREREERERAEAAQRLVAVGGVNATADTTSDARTLPRLCFFLWRLLETLSLPTRWSPHSFSTPAGGSVIAFDSIPMGHDPTLASPIGTSANPPNPPTARDAPSNHTPSALPSDTSSSQSSRHRRKWRGSAYSRTRASFRYIRRCRKQRTEVGSLDVIMVSIAELSSFELLKADDDDASGEWEDLEAAKLRIVV
ncbi:hypothetical protein C8Q73DRAFT_709864 [Cubamyces lactineus]|nr:hypothetical protein C8Q73DRAFT_709864 [Cubamyces lactineus]